MNELEVRAKLVELNEMLTDFITELEKGKGYEELSESLIFFQFSVNDYLLKLKGL